MSKNKDINPWHNTRPLLSCIDLISVRILKKKQYIIRNDGRIEGAQWLSGRVLDLRLKGHGF